MHVKTFRHKTLKGALHAAKVELGPDALVLSTGVVHASGLRGLIGGQLVEITAAVERQAVSETRQGAPGHRTLGPGGDEIAARLNACGMDLSMARAIAEAHPRATRRGKGSAGIEETVAAHLAALTSPDDDLAAVEVFVGPPGVGKTTTIAKIATQARTRHGRRLSLVAADGYRVGAVEQLRLYADILGSPLAVARTADELDHVVGTLKGPVLLDTPGRSPGDDITREIFARLARVPGARTHLVLPASLPASLARKTVERFGDARPSRIVITKLDEVDSLAPLIGVLQETGLPVSFVGTGQRVPEDLHRATPAALASWVLGTHVAGASA